MSMGVGGWAEVFAEDDTMVIYSYGSYDLNEPAHRNDGKIRDGSIGIYKHNLHGKLRESLTEFLKSGGIEIVNCSNCWHTIEKYDHIALSLLSKIAHKYDKNHEFPVRAGWHT